jgi:hypothetical protein
LALKKGKILRGVYLQKILINFSVAEVQTLMYFYNLLNYESFKIIVAVLPKNSKKKQEKMGNFASKFNSFQSKICINGGK